MDSKAQQKVVLVTGASSGIGYAVAGHLAACGWRTFGTSRSPAPAATPDGVEMIALDVDDDASVESGVAEVVRRAGRLDAVVNNAGWALMGPIEETSMAEARAQMETNFFGTLRVCRTVLPLLRDQGGGHIVNISSLGGAFGMPFSGLYSASKFAVEGLTESLRLETRRFGIRVVLVEPGDTQSALPSQRRTAAAARDDSAYADIFRRYQQQQAEDEARAPTPAAVAQLVERILRDRAPRLRYSVGMLGQRVVLPLKRLLPQRAFEAIISRAMGV